MSFSNSLGTFPSLGETMPGQDVEMKGMFNWFECRNYRPTTAYQQRFVGAKILAVLLENNSGAAVLPKQMYELRDDANGTYDLVTEVDAVCATVGQDTVVLADPWMLAAGCPDASCFWGICKGPAIAKTPQAAGDFYGDISIGDPLEVSGDAAGRLATAQTSGSGSQVLVVAYALEAKTMAAGTDADIWVQMNVPWC